jgi:Tfp pilus assembly protein FimT
VAPRLLLGVAAMNTHRSSRGFTLIELLVVFAVIMGLALFTLPMMLEAIEGSKLRGIVQGTVSLMRLARIQAIKTNGCGLLELDPARRQVSGYLDQDCDTTTNNVLLGTLAFPAGIDATPDFTGNVVFRGTGSADKFVGEDETTGTIRFVNRGGTAKTIAVARATGKISVE